MKACIKCGTHESYQWYTGPICKKCYQQTPQVKEAASKQQQKIGSRFAKSKQRGIKIHKEWAITIDEYAKLISKPCYYCEDFFAAKSKYGSGLDRIDNTKGYTVDNVLPCCKQCNSIRNNFLTVEETKIAVTAIINYRKSRAAL